MAPQTCDVTTIDVDENDSSLGDVPFARPSQGKHRGGNDIEPPAIRNGTPGTLDRNLRQAGVNLCAFGPWLSGGCALLGDHAEHDGAFQPGEEDRQEGCNRVGIGRHGITGNVIADGHVGGPGR